MNPTDLLEEWEAMPSGGSQSIRKEAVEKAMASFNGDKAKFRIKLALSLYKNKHIPLQRAAEIASVDAKKLQALIDSETAGSDSNASVSAA